MEPSKERSVSTGHNAGKVWLVVLTSIWFQSEYYQYCTSASNLKFWPVRSSQLLKVMSFNIRYDNLADKAHGNGWDTRLPMVVNQITKHSPDIVGTQEGLLHQLHQLKQALHEKGMNYSFCGSARERFLGCFPCGEHCAIFSSQSLHSVVQASFALSETPSCIGSRSWGTGCPRIATYSWFQFSSSSACVLFLNTHLDHVSQRARALGSELIVRVLDELEKAPPPACQHIATIVAGDFNSLQRDANGIPEAPFSAFRSFGFRDACSEFGARSCPFLTFHGYKPASALHAQSPRNPATRPLRRGMIHGHIDWILWRGSLKLIDFEVDTTLQDGMPPSDHFPIIATFRLHARGQKTPTTLLCSYSYIIQFFGYQWPRME